MAGGQECLGPSNDGQKAETGTLADSVHAEREWLLMFSLIDSAATREFVCHGCDESIYIHYEYKEDISSQTLFLTTIFWVFGPERTREKVPDFTRFSFQTLEYSRPLVIWLFMPLQVLV